MKRLIYVRKILLRLIFFLSSFSFLGNLRSFGLSIIILGLYKNDAPHFFRVARRGRTGWFKNPKCGQ